MNRLLAVDKPPTCAGEWLMPPGENDEWSAQWIEDGFPWCDTCGEPAVFSESHGNLHATEAQRYGVPPHSDQSGHAVTMGDWANDSRWKLT